jgi:hypothetical protein
LREFQKLFVFQRSLPISFPRLESAAQSALVPSRQKGSPPMSRQPKLQVKLPFVQVAAEGTLAVCAAILIILAALALFRL